VKEIKAVVQPARLARVREALRHVPGFPGMTVTAVEGCSAVETDPPPGIRAELTDYSRKTRIEVVCQDDQVDTIVAAIVGAASSGQKGDGLVWVTEVSAMRRLRDT
jgi:nitrogen regulatory protein P-II 1